MYKWTCTVQTHAIQGSTVIDLGDNGSKPRTGEGIQVSLRLEGKRGKRE